MPKGRYRRYYDQAPGFIRAAEHHTDSSDTHENGGMAKRSLMRYMCLLLKPTDVPAHFERVGYVEFDSPDFSREDDKWLKTRDIRGRAELNRASIDDVGTDKFP